MEQLKAILGRLKRPSIIISLVSEIISILIIFGININENYIMTVVAALCSVLVTLGILSNPDTQTKSYGDDMLTCAKSGRKEPHVLINGQMVCKNCGTVHYPDNLP